MNNIADVIQEHINDENKENVMSPAIGGGQIYMNNASWEVWIVNRPYMMTSIYRRNLYGEVVSVEGTDKKESIRYENGVSICKNTF